MARIRTALLTAAFLTGSLAAGFGAGAAIAPPPPAQFSNVRTILAAIAALALVCTGGALWARVVGRSWGADRPWALMLAGGLSFGPVAIGCGFALSALEAVAAPGLGTTRLPIHVLFMLLFVPAVFLVAGASSFFLGVAIAGRALGGRLGLRGGGVAALAFLLVVLLMDLLGWRVGAPGAAERATMVTVTVLGALAASLAGGAAIAPPEARVISPPRRR